MNREITCWEDAGSWKSLQHLALTSLYRRVEALRNAALERCRLCYQPGIGMIDKPFLPLQYPIRVVNDLSTVIASLIPHFIQIRENTLAAVTLTSGKTDHVFQNVSLADGNCSVETDSGSFSFIFQDGIGVLKSVETCAVDDLRDIAGVLRFRTFDTESLLREFPLFPPDSARLCSFCQWIWNAYSILRLLRHPNREITLGCCNFQQSERRWKAYRVYTDNYGTYSYSINGGGETVTDSRPGEAELWNKAHWIIGGENQSFAVRKQQIFFGTPSDPNLRGSSIEVQRNCVDSVGQNRTTACLTGSWETVSLPVEMLYRKCFRPYLPGDDFLYEGFLSNRWIDLFSGTLEPDGIFDSSGPYSTEHPDGIFGSNADGWRHRELSWRFDPAETYGMTFIADRESSPET